jgi:prepilin-type processing-associated H-X9-DG protein
MKKRRWTSWGTLALATCGLTVLLSAWVVAQDDIALQERAACQANLHQLGLALSMYTQDYDDRLPPANKWTPSFLPYLEGTAVLKCPSDKKTHSYAMNQLLNGRAVLKIYRPDKTPSLFESNLHRSSASGTTAVIAKPPRHDDGNNYLFVDGRVQWLTKPPLFDNTPKPKKPKKPAKPAPRQ